MRGARPPRRVGQPWATFLRNHAPEIWACDFLPVTDVFFQPLYAFIIIVLGSRQVVHVGVTRHPTDAWVAQQLREATPFGQGQPFSRGQLTQLLRESMFSPAGWEAALFVPPFDWRPLMRSAGAWERAGGLMWPRFSGVILVEATKQIYAATPVTARMAAIRRMRVLAPIPRGAVQTREPL